jgi:adenylate cyclase
MTPALFVARERELQALHGYLDRTLAGQGQVCFVVGEAGSGKTTLLNEFVRRALEANPDLVAAVGQSDAQTGMGDSYLPFREILAQLTGDVEPKVAQGAISEENAGRLRKLLRFSGQALAEVGPDLIGVFIPFAGLATRAVAFIADRVGWLDKLEQLADRRQAGGPSAGSGIQQDHIFEQYTNVLRALAEKNPLLLILDDLHWADAGSTSLLFRLGRRIDDRRILIVGTYRPAEVDLGRAGQRHPLAEVLAEFKRYRGDVTVDLAQTASDGRAFVEAFLDAEPNVLGASFREDLFHHTGGHPLFTVELLRYLQERGDLTQDAQGRWTAPAQLQWPQLPARVEGVIQERIGRLAAELRQALTVASVEGEEFTAEVVARVEDVPARELVRRLGGELERQHRLVHAEGLVRVGGQRLSRYRFQHNLFQKYLYQQLDPSERSYLHEDVGTALEEFYGDQRDEIVVQLARHFCEAEITEKATAYLRQAGDQAAARYAHVEALDYYAQALALTEDPEERYALLLGQEGVHSLQGDREAQRRDIEALEILAAGGDDGQQAEVLLRKAQLAEVTGDFAGAIAAAQASVQLAQQAHSEPIQAVGHRVWGGALIRQGNIDQARVQLEQALRISRELGDRQGEGLTLGRLGLAAYFKGDHAAALDCYQQALEIFRQEGDRHGEVTVLGRMGPIFAEQGDLRAARLSFEQTASLARQLGFRHGEATALGNLGNVCAELGDYGAARSYFDQSYRLCEETGDLEGAGRVLGNLGALCSDQGDLPAARAAMEEALAIARRIGSARNEEKVLGNLGSLCCIQGDYAAARAHHEHALEVVRQMGNRGAEVFHLNGLSEDLAVQGDYAAAESYALQALQIARDSADPDGESDVLLSLGTIRESLGALDRAEEFYERSLGIARELGNRRAEGIRLSAQGQLLGRLGKLAAAHEALEQALRIAGEICDPLTEATTWARLGQVLLASGELAEADAAYRRALALRQELGQSHLVPGCRAGLARVALARGDTGEALTHVRAVQAQLEAGPLPGAAATLQVYLDCYRVLAALEDPQAEAYRAAAQGLLQEQAGRIPDEETRRAFLEGSADLEELELLMSAENRRRIH